MRQNSPPFGKADAHERFEGDCVIDGVFVLDPVNDPVSDDDAVLDGVFDDVGVTLPVELGVMAALRVRERAAVLDGVVVGKAVIGAVFDAVPLGVEVIDGVVVAVEVDELVADELTEEDGVLPLVPVVELDTVVVRLCVPVTVIEGWGDAVAVTFLDDVPDLVAVFA